MGSSVSRPKLRRHPSPSYAASKSCDTPIIRPPLPVLPPEVLLIIFNLAHETTPLSSLRVVSRQFDNLLVPIIYRQVILNPKIVACFQAQMNSPIQLQIAKDIRTYTEHVSIVEELHWPSVLQLLYTMENLQELWYEIFENPTLNEFSLTTTRMMY